MSLPACAKMPVSGPRYPMRIGSAARAGAAASTATITATPERNDVMPLLLEDVDGNSDTGRRFRKRAGQTYHGHRGRATSASERKIAKEDAVEPRSAPFDRRATGLRLTLQRPYGPVPKNCGRRRRARRSVARVLP